MSEFDKLKTEAEQLEQQHPQQVKEGEQYVEKDLGIGQQNQGGQSQGGQGGNDGGQNQDQGQNQNQNQGQ